MTSTLTSLINHNFGGIRRKDSMFSDEKITCSDCQNVELFNTELNSAVGLRTAKGNIKFIDTIPDGEQVVGIFETIQRSTTHYLVYTETTGENAVGKLYEVSLTTLTLNNTGAVFTTATGCAQGCDFTQGWSDVFAFSNGVDIKFIYTNLNAAGDLWIAGDTDSSLGSDYKLKVDLNDVEQTSTPSSDHVVSGLGIVNYDKRLWVFNGTRLWYSRRDNVGVFNNTDFDTTDSNRAGLINLTKNITAIHEYLGSLAVFHKNSSCLVMQDTTTLFKVTDESPGGCASYNSLVFHGTDLFFYDDSKKGVFSFQQVVNGDKTLSDNIAYDIQDELMSIQKDKLSLIRTLSVITADRNEVWFLIPLNATYTVKETVNDALTDVDKPASIIMIFDYIRGEWIKRKCQHINCIGIVDGVLYSGGKQIYTEYQKETFDGDYISNYYQCTVMNMGTDNTLKITKFPPRLTIDASYKNHFFVKYVKNYNITKKPKIKELFSKTFGNTLKYDTEKTYDGGYTYRPGAISGIIKMPSATFKALEITFYTNEENQEFTIKSFEFSKIKVKQI